jgi:glycosyltransferase involved in cell wall biosynthesis
MKIAHICPFYTPAIGGVKQVVEELAKRQVKLGHEVHIYTSDWDKEKRITPLEEKIQGIQVHRCPHWIRAANFMTFWPSVFPKLLKQDFDVIHSHLFGHPHFVLSALAAKLKGAKYIHTTHCPWSDSKRSLVGKLGLIISYHTFSRLSLKITDKIIAITPWEKNFIKKFGGDENKIKVLPNGMDKTFFKKINNNDFRKKLKIKPNQPLILFFGRLNITKGPEKFVEIAKLILKEKPNYVFVILGPDEGMLEIVKQKIGNEKRIILLPAIRDRKEIIKMYQTADVYVMPSYREGLPLTLFEAMASGLPIVASPVNGIPYEMKNQENGFLVNHGDNKKFKEKIIELIDNLKLRKQISNNNLKKAKNYNWDLINKKTMEIYKK